MAWFIGIDEAGYGPNLGPFVQVAVGIHSDDDQDPQPRLGRWFRRATERDAKRLLVDDSKKVNTGKQGFAKLEQAMIALFGLHKTTTLAAWLDPILLPQSAEELAGEAWYQGELRLPLSSTTRLPSLLQTAEPGVSFHLLSVNIVPTPWFNRILAGSGTKGTIPLAGMVSLLGSLRHVVSGFDPIIVTCDKLGGRNRYSDLIQAAFTSGWVVSERESAMESRYRIESFGRDVQVTFRPRADADRYETALASMAAKYLRELLMQQFNQYWQQQIPELAPTKGYPTDAKRFFEQIEHLLAKFNLTKMDVWREK